MTLRADRHTFLNTQIIYRILQSVFPIAIDIVNFRHSLPVFSIAIDIVNFRHSFYFI
uniref:Uncharacterized protein n=1 Tax=Meloidogyne incognita TaxID=6306 RepID=A0A914LBP5_MELIC